MQRPILVTLVILGMGLWAGATKGDDPAATQPAQKTIRGTLVRVDGKTLVLKTADTAALKVPTNEKTQVTIDMVQATLDALKPGRRVLVTVAEGVAVKVQAMGAPPPKG